MVEVIRCLHKLELDITRYDRCISLSMHGRIYAYSWYLDCICDQYEVLVLDDYKAVMPLPWRRKFGIKYIYTPAWAQQLGIFSEEKLTEKLVMKFLRSIPRRFFKVDYRMNSANQVNLSNLVTKKNYILNLDKPYAELIKGFKASRRKSAALNYKACKLNKKVSFKDFLHFFGKVEKNYQLGHSELVSLEKLAKLDKDRVGIWSIDNKEGMQAGLMWLKDHKRLTYLLPVASRVGKEKELATFLVLELIKAHENSDLILDFEGSMIEGVEQFYKSFGAIMEPYYVYRKRLFTYE